MTFRVIDVVTLERPIQKGDYVDYVLPRYRTTNAWEDGIVLEVGREGHSLTIKVIWPDDTTDWYSRVELVRVVR